MQNLLLKERKQNEKLQQEIVNIKKENEVSRHERIKLTQRVHKLKETNEELQNNYDILTNIYEQKREECFSLSQEIRQKNNCILELRDVEARYLKTKPQTTYEVQVNIIKEK